jgi:hypothetical protein
MFYFLLYLNKMNKSIILLLLLLFNGRIIAQEFENLFDNYTGENKTNFLQPLNEVIIPNFNQGWFQSPTMKKGFHFNIGVNVSVGYVTDNIKTFKATTESSVEFPFEPEQTATVPTIVGSIYPVEVEGINGTSYLFPGGANLKISPFAIPQLTIGNLFGTEFTFRFFTYDINDDFGKLQHIGGAVRHNLSQYLPLGKFDWNVGYGFQAFSIGDKADIKSHLVFMDIGQHPGHFYYFGRLGYQSGVMKIDYENTEEEIKVKFDLNEVFPLIVSIGGGIDLWKFRLHTAISYSKIPFAEAGLFLNF